MKITKDLLREMIAEELSSLSEAEYAIKDKVGQIVNAWGSYQFKSDKDSLHNLIRVLKSFDVPKPAAMKILQAKKQDEVVSVVKSL